MSPGKKAAVLGAGVGGGALLTALAIVKAVEAANPTTDPSGGGSSGTSTGNGNWSLVRSTTFVCGNRRCTSGSITIHVPVAISQGLSFAVANQGSGGGYLVGGPARTNGATDVTYDSTGSQSAMICQPITFVNVFDGYVNTGTNLNTVVVSIPVSCQ